MPPIAATISVAPGRSETISFLSTMLLPRKSNAALAFFLLFAVLSVFVARGFTKSWDTQTVHAFAEWRRPLTIRVMQALSDLGNWHFEIPLALGIAALLSHWKHGGEARRFLFVAVSGEAIYALAKLSFHRPRPTIVAYLSDAGWYSYPSGHAMLAWIVWGFGLALLAHVIASRGARLALRTTALVLPCLISISRIYLGVHYPTDVLAGLLLAIGWVLLWWGPRSLASRWDTSSAPATR
jgi:undecaprenyl-diphosphatase